MSTSLTTLPIAPTRVSRSWGLESYPKWEGRILALVVFIVSLFVGYEMVFRYHLIPSGAYNRAIDGLYMVWGGNFHLAAMSFYWSPMVSLLSVPFALLRGLWSPLVTLEFSSNIISSLFAAIGVYHLNRILWQFGFGIWARILWSALYFLNPLILIYSANGMSDGAEAALIIASLDGLIEYLESDTLGGLIKGASWLAAAFMMRYESVPIGAAIALGLAIAIWRRERNFQRTQAIAIAFLFPVVMAGVIWMLLNWMIKKNPLWFMEAKSSNSAQISSGAYNFPQVVAADHHILPTLYEVVHFTDNFWPFFILLAIVVSLQFRRHPNPVGLPIALGSLGAPLFQAVLLYKHSSADWDRFFIYYIPFGFLLGAFLLSRVAKPKLRNVLAVLSCLVLISADYGAWQGLHSSVWGNGSTGYISAIGQKINEFAHLDGRRVRYRGEFINVYQQLTPMQGIADYVNKHPALRVLVVADIMPWIERPNQVIFGNEADFQAVLLNPRGRVNSIIVAPSATLSQDVDAIDRQYPTMWGGGVPWTRLVKQLPAGYRLYEVLDNAP